jgi:hypothetical protein
MIHDTERVMEKGTNCLIVRRLLNGGDDFTRGKSILLVLAKTKKQQNNIFKSGYY